MDSLIAKINELCVAVAAANTRVVELMAAVATAQIPLQRQNAVVNTTAIGPVPAINPAHTPFPEELANKYLEDAHAYRPDKSLIQKREEARCSLLDAMKAASNPFPPKGMKGELRAAERAARRAFNEAHIEIRDANERADRFNEYHSGTFASNGDNLYFIYRFYVFEVPRGSAYNPTTWKPVGMLNPHAYIRSKMSGAKKSFLEFADKTVASPWLPADLF